MANMLRATFWTSFWCLQIVVFYANFGEICSKSSINNKPALVQIMARSLNMRQLLRETMLIQINDAMLRN